MTTALRSWAPEGTYLLIVNEQDFDIGQVVTHGPDGPRVRLLGRCDGGKSWRMPADRRYVAPWKKTPIVAVPWAAVQDKVTMASGRRTSRLTPAGVRTMEYYIEAFEQCLRATREPPSHPLHAPTVHPNRVLATLTLTRMDGPPVVPGADGEYDSDTEPLAAKRWRNRPVTELQ